MEQCYWDNTGKHQADYDRLIAFMPMSGNCGTLEIEAIRAASKIAYELYNNGFLYNNWSGPYNFLNSLGIPEMRETLDVIKDYRFGTSHYYWRTAIDGDEIQMAVEKIVNLVIEWIKERETKGPFDKSDVDMWSYQEEVPAELLEDDEEDDFWNDETEEEDYV